MDYATTLNIDQQGRIIIPVSYTHLAGNVSSDGFTNIPENTPPQQLPFP